MSDEGKLQHAPQARAPYAMIACPCCGYATLTARGLHDLCPVCFWEDDGQDNADADEERGRPNPVCLLEGRASFLAFGASVEHDRGKVRPPRPEELPLRRFDERGRER